MMTLFYTVKVITDPDLEFFSKMPEKVITFGQKNEKSASVMTLFYTARVITELDLKFFFREHMKKLQLLV